MLFVIAQTVINEEAVNADEGDADNRTSQEETEVANIFITLILRFKHWKACFQNEHKLFCFLV